MAHDIFKLFKNSIEKVQVMKMPRSDLDIPTPEYNVQLDCIVKRRNLMAGAIENSEDRNNNTTLHFRQKDAEYVLVGNYVEIDGNWHSILQVRDGKDFDKGESKFVYAFLNNDIKQMSEDIVWQ